jgi:hypothetical protein
LRSPNLWASGSEVRRQSKRSDQILVRSGFDFRRQGSTVKRRGDGIARAVSMFACQIDGMATGLDDAPRRPLCFDLGVASLPYLLD